MNVFPDQYELCLEVASLISAKREGIPKTYVNPDLKDSTKECVDLKYIDNLGVILCEHTELMQFKHYEYYRKKFNKYFEKLLGFTPMANIFAKEELAGLKPYLYQIVVDPKSITRLKGETPVVKTTGARFGLNMISAISPRGHLRFMCIEGKVNALVFVEFLKRLMYKADRPIFLVVDGHPIHKSKIAKQYIESTNGKLTLFFLLPYSPQLNPDESVWREVKNHHIGRTPVTGPKHLYSLAMSALRSLQRSPNTLRGLFKTPELSYIPLG